MKKFGIFMCSLALAGMMFTSCEGKQNGGGNIDINNLVEDGFYAVGDACPIKSVNDKDAVLAQMSQGINEVLMDQKKLPWEESKRAGMWEKYIYLEADKDFELILKEGANATIYGADLTKQELVTDGSPLEGYKGSLIIGKKMKVQETGLYHIVLDLNMDGALDLTGKEQIIVAPVTWGVSGAMNGWGMTEGTMEFKSAKEIVWTWKDCDMAAGGKFKFKDVKSAWKIVLDDAGAVKAHTNLGVDCQNGGADIAVEKGGLYDITLTYNLAKGVIANSYKYEVVLTKESTLPTTMNMIGEEFGNWLWDNAGVVELTPVHSKPGMFWCTRLISAGKPFKFCAKKEWNGDFYNLGAEDTGFTVTDNNCTVAETGVYTIVIDIKGAKITIAKAEVFGIGDAFGSWDAGKYPFTIKEDGTATITTAAAGNLRMYTAVPGVDWWQAEYNIYDGKIQYRGEGGDQAAVAVAANATVTVNFNAGTGEIK
jgi:hypothetical protein